MAGRYNRQDHVYKAAKEQGFRSRAYFKLQELQKHHSLIRRGDKVVDLGAWPGGWMELSHKLVGENGLVVGIDLKQIEDFGEENIQCVVGDVRDDEVLSSALDLAGGKFDVLLSGMSPKLTGVKAVDRTAAIGLAETALWVAGEVLKKGGNWVVKVFKSNEAEEFYRATRPLFTALTREHLSSTRKTSNEFYIVGKGFVGTEQS